MCAVPIYYQNQQYYSNDVMLSAGETIGNAGCALTSLTMLFDYFQSIDGHATIGDPRGMNNCLSPWGYADGLNWVGAQVNPSSGPGCDHYTSNWISQAGFDWPTLDSYLRSGWPVIVGGCWNAATSCWPTHWVVVIGGNGSDIASNYWINNPAYGATNNMQGLINTGFTFKWMSLYQNGAGTGSPCE
jgi:hypothetical protein